MNWLTNFIRPKINSIVDQKDVPDNLWQKCPSCEGMLFSRDLKENMNVCSHCGHHMKISVAARLKIMFDDGNYKITESPKAPADPLKFKDRKRYVDRLRDTRQKIGRDDAIVIASGKIGGNKAVVAAFDFAFMGGSMGAAVGEGIVKASEMAVKDGAALIVVPTSGGARMQEGAISLMQMPRTIIAAEMVKEAGLPYLVLLTDPTTGGVSASFAMVGDIHMAEPGTTIGFAGKRVIQETIREELPEGFQTAEYLLEHGMLDMVVERKDLNETIGRILGILLGQKTEGTKPAKKEKASGNNKTASGSKKASNSNNNASNGSKNKVKAKKITKIAKVKTKAKTGKPANTNQKSAQKPVKAVKQTTA